MRATPVHGVSQDGVKVDGSGEKARCSGIFFDFLCLGGCFSAKPHPPSMKGWTFETKSQRRGQGRGWEGEGKEHCFASFYYVEEVR